MVDHGHEQLIKSYDKDTGLRALIGIHDTTLGPALGGTRLWKYKSHEDAVLDVLRLSEGMTFKSAVAGIQLGGGKAVIIADGKENDPVIRTARFEAFGRIIEGIGGRYITAEDVGTTIPDMEAIQKHTKHVTGSAKEKGGSGDPSPATAFGNFRSIQALAEELLGTDDLKGLRVSIQGLGKVGMDLAKWLVEAGAIVIGADIVPAHLKEAQEKYNVEIVEPDAIYDVECDIFAPCALGAILNDNTIPRLKCKIIAGSANNQLAEPRHGEALKELGIFYAVDYVVNAGGVINVFHEIGVKYDEKKATDKVSKIYNTIKQLIQVSRDEDVSTYKAAQRMALDAIAAGKK